jgi:hypothetical protein
MTDLLLFIIIDNKWGDGMPENSEPIPAQWKSRKRTASLSEQGAEFALWLARASWDINVDIAPLADKGSFLGSLVNKDCNGLILHCCGIRFALIK